MACKAKRAKGGGLEAQEDEDKEREGTKKPQERKRGGRVHGEKAASRPDRRARGGSVGSDPVSAAGKVAEPGFVSKSDKDRG